MLRQIAEVPVTPFAQHGVDEWPDVEQLLGRALSKDPAARFPSTRDFARAWRAIEIPRAAAEAAPAEATKLRGVCADMLRKSALGGLWMSGQPLASPATSLNYGSAGIAYANLGIAHGWAGLLYATLCWCAATGEPLPSALADRLDQLGECAEPVNRCLHWKWDLASGHHNPASQSMPGWCNGSAGYVFLWTEAHEAIGEKQYLELAEGADVRARCIKFREAVPQ
jgi:hypothetical protein